MDEMDYVMHPTEPSTPRSQQPRQYSGCPYMRGESGGSPISQANPSLGLSPGRFDLHDIHGGSPPWYHSPGPFQWSHPPVPLQQGGQLQQPRGTRLPPPFLGSAMHLSSQPPLPAPLSSFADPGLLHDPFAPQYAWAAPRAHANPPPPAHERIPEQRSYHSGRPSNGVHAVAPPAHHGAASSQHGLQGHHHYIHRQSLQPYPHQHAAGQHSSLYLERLPALSNAATHRLMADIAYSQHPNPQPPHSHEQIAPQTSSSGESHSSVASQRRSPTAAQSPSRHTLQESPTDSTPQPAPEAGPRFNRTTRSAITRASIHGNISPSHGLPPPPERASERLNDRLNDSTRRVLAAAAAASVIMDTDNSEDDSDILEEEERALHFMSQVSPGQAQPGNLSAMSEERVRAQQLFRGSIVNRRVASKHALSTLESVEPSSLPESERMCIICYNDFGTPTPEGINEAPLRLPRCKHVFGDHCIKKWFEESDSCPYCRDKVPSEPQLRSTSQALNHYIQTQMANQLANHHRQVRSTAHPSTGGGPSSLPSGPEALPRGWQPGERRSPPDMGESRRRTRPRHGSFRFSSASSYHGTYGHPGPRPNSFGGASNQPQNRDHQNLWHNSPPAPQHYPVQPQPIPRPAAQQQNQAMDSSEFSLNARAPTYPYPSAPSLPTMSSLGLNAPQQHANMHPEAHQTMPQHFFSRSTQASRVPHMNTPAASNGALFQGSSSQDPHANPPPTVPIPNFSFPPHMPPSTNMGGGPSMDGSAPAPRGDNMSP